MGYLNHYYINKNNLLKNIKIIKEKLNPETKLCAVVKANAYGVGVREVVSIVKDEVDYYAVANIEEALELRKLDKDKEILILGYVSFEDIELAVIHNLSITIISKEYFLGLTEHLKKFNLKSLKIHIKINTGLNRFGLSKTEFIRIIQILKEDESLFKFEGCYTHFATKSSDEEFLEKQFREFESVTKLCGKKVVKHCSNTYATLTHLEMQMDMVRVGFGLYGMEENMFGLQPVIKIESEIINILNLKVGESVGYDRTFRAKNNTKIAVVPIGYADGFSRNLSNNFELYVNGKFAKVVGRICMDICFIDVTNIDVKIGNKVEIMGEKISTTKFSNILNTSTYEILLNFNKMRCVRQIV